MTFDASFSLIMSALWLVTQATTSVHKQRRRQVDLDRSDLNVIMNQISTALVVNTGIINTSAWPVSIYCLQAINKLAIPRYE